jgi:hypothetical protein
MNVKDVLEADNTHNVIELYGRFSLSLPLKMFLNL